MTPSPLLDEILAHGLMAGTVIADEIRVHILELLDRTLPTDEFLRQARAVVATHEPLLARSLSDTMLAGWLLGGLDALGEPPDEEGDTEPALDWPNVSQDQPEAVEPIVLGAIDEAVTALRSWKVLSPAEYASASAQARSAAFTVAHITSLDTLEAIKKAAWENLQEGGNEVDFKKKVDKVLAGRAAPLSDRHVETIWRTNFSRAITVGQERTLRHPLVEDEFPFRITMPIRDGRLSDLCRIISRSGLEGTNIFYYDDPVWRKFAVPRHWS